MSGKLDIDCMAGDLGNRAKAGDVAVEAPPRPADGRGDFGGSPAAAALPSAPAPGASSPLEAVLTVLRGYWRVWRAFENARWERV